MSTPEQYPSERTLHLVSIGSSLFVASSFFGVFLKDCNAMSNQFFFMFIACVSLVLFMFSFITFNVFVRVFIFPIYGGIMLSFDMFRRRKLGMLPKEETFRPPNI